MARRILVADDEIFPYLQDPSRYVAVRLNIAIAPNMEANTVMKEKPFGTKES